MPETPLPQPLPTSATPEATDMPAPTRRRLQDLFTPAQIRTLTRRSDAWGAWAVGSTWAVIGGALALAAWHPAWWTVLLAVVVVAGRQLSLAILQHEASHGTLFRTRVINEFVGEWLCARPVWQNLHKYRQHHFRHHTRTGTDEDPDLSLHENFPVSPASLRRKLLRDITGQTGLKTVYGLVLMDAGILKWTVSNEVEWLPQEGRTRTDQVVTALRNMAPMLAVNGVLWGLCALAGHAWVYGLWVLAFITPLPLFIRIRSIAEHGCLERTPDMFLNTRTTRAGWLARATVAPVHVNYHLEHHVMASVPWQTLPLMHRWLRERQVLGDAPTYLEVLKLAGSGGPHGPADTRISP